MKAKMHKDTLPPPGDYRDVLLKEGTWVGDWLRIDRAALRKILSVHRPEKLKEYPGLGDLVERAVKPIARAMGHPCLDKEKTGLRVGSPCDERRKKVNKVGEKFGL
jgi:hypothetical protein